MPNFFLIRIGVLHCGFVHSNWCYWVISSNTSNFSCPNQTKPSLVTQSIGSASWIFYFHWAPSKAAFSLRLVIYALIFLFFLVRGFRVYAMAFLVSSPGVHSRLYWKNCAYSTSVDLFDFIVTWIPIRPYSSKRRDSAVIWWVYIYLLLCVPSHSVIDA